MNPFEQKLSRQPLRPPPPAWRAEILGAAEKIVTPAAWRAWFWPSPAAWGALAAVWIVAFIFGANEQPSPAQPPVHSIASRAAPVALYAFQSPRDLAALLDTLH